MPAPGPHGEAGQSYPTAWSCRWSTTAGRRPGRPAMEGSARHDVSGCGRPHPETSAAQPRQTVDGIAPTADNTHESPQAPQATVSAQAPTVVSHWTARSCGAVVSLACHPACDPGHATGRFLRPGCTWVCHPGVSLPTITSTRARLAPRSCCRPSSRGQLFPPPTGAVRREEGTGVGPSTPDPHHRGQALPALAIPPYSWWASARPGCWVFVSRVVGSKRLGNQTDSSTVVA